MKAAIINLAAVATLAVAQPHHGHGHFHQKKGNSPIEAREEVTETVAATATVYQLGDKQVSPEEAEAGLKDGLYVMVGETTPTMTTPTSSATPTPSTSSQQLEAAQFFQKTSALSSSATPTPSTTSSSSAAAASTSAASSGSASTGTGMDREFPNGKLDCSQFPSEYGALAVDWLDTNGWSSLQYTPNYKIGDLSISYIVSGVSGQGCKKNGFCSYACPEGYVKTQWPADAQGSTGQSIGGLYCNSDGKLELTRPSYKTLCQEGVGGVAIKNELSSKGAAVCRTDYPGLENMVIPIDTQPGGEYTVANVDSSDYFVWEGKSTTLQYYINPKGVSVQDACVWSSPAPNKDCAGNWAPTILGVGRDSSGITYLSLFPNSPTSTATLDFDIEITGNFNGECSLKNGQYAGSSSGCTIAIPKDGNAVLHFKDSS